MPSKSRSQQRLFGMVHACQKTGRCASPEVEKIASEISKKGSKEFAKTKHKGLPNKVKKKAAKKKKKTKNKGAFMKFSEWIERRFTKFEENNRDPNPEKKTPTTEAHSPAPEAGKKID